MELTHIAQRYSRQELFPGIGKEGQQRLAKSKVAIIGMGALGTVLSTQLVRAGVGYVRLIDRDIIEPSNLQRQSLYDESDAESGRAKADAAAEKLRKANSEVTVDSVVVDLDGRNAENLLSGMDVLVDGTDNFQVRYLINEVAYMHGIPWSYGGAVSSYGTTAFFEPGVTPCLACVFGEQAPSAHDTCDTVGVIAPVVSVVASLQVADVLKYLTGRTERLHRGLTYVDVWQNEFRNMNFPPKQDQCPVCGLREFPMLHQPTDALTVSFCGRQTIQVRRSATDTFSLAELADRLSAIGPVRKNASLVRFEQGNVQLTVFADGRALIHGVDDPAQARSIYARYVGM